MNKLPYLNTMSLGRLKQLKNNTICLVLDPKSNEKKGYIIRKSKTACRVGNLAISPSGAVGFVAMLYYSNNGVPRSILSEKELINTLRSRSYSLSYCSGALYHDTK